MLSLEITSIKNMRLFLEVAEQLGYESGKVRLVLNRADSTLGIRVADVEHSIGRKVDDTIVSDGRSVVYALNRGVPFFLSQSGGRRSPRTSCGWPRSVVGERRRPRPPTRPEGDPEEVAVRMAMITSVIAAPRGEKGCRRCPC